MEISPIALFVYNRPEHTRKTVEALQKNKLADQSDLFVFSDAPKNEEAKEGVDPVRVYIKGIAGFRSVTIVERGENFGLAKSIIGGVTDIVNTHGEVIVLEDDLITSPYFLTYMNEALELYKTEEKVISIHGYVYPVKEKLPDTFFIRGADCWGWATWKRGWDLFEADGAKLLGELTSSGLAKTFDLGGSYPYTQMLRAQIKGLNDSWAIRWYASAFLADKLTLYPSRSLVKNVGFDDSGTHTGSTNLFSVSLSSESIDVGNIKIEESKLALKAIKRFFRSPKLLLFVIYLKLKNFIRLNTKNGHK